MFFCPQCSYSLDLKKSSIVIGSNKTYKVKSVTNGIKLIINENIEPSMVFPNFTREQLLKNKNYGKLSVESKNKMLEMFDQVGGSNVAMFSCNNCNWSEDLNQTVRLYSYSKDDKVVKVLDSEYLMIFNNPIYSRTKDYTCKNSECVTHKKPELKEAVFYRDNNSLVVKYVCGKCLNSWESN